MRLRATIICLITAFSAQLLCAKDTYLIEITPGKKVLHASEVSLPETTTLGELLGQFPELLSREGDKKLDNYDLQVNGISTGKSEGAMLENLRLCDIKDIEVSKNPGTSQQKNGQGGVINVKLKDSQEGFSGRAHISAGTLWDVVPGVRMSYRKNNLELNGSLMMEYYNPRINNESTTSYNSYGIKKYQTDSCNLQSGYQLLNLHLKYDDGKDIVKAWMREGYSIENANHNLTALDQTYNFSNKVINKKDFNLYTGAEYEHKFKETSIIGQVEYTYDPLIYNATDKDVSTRSDNLDFQDKTRSHNISSFLKGKWSRVFSKERNEKIEIVGGVNESFNPVNYNYNYKGPFGPLHDGRENKILNSKGSSLYLSPFIESTASWEAVFLKAGLRFQYYHYLIDITDNDDKPFKSDRNDFTAFINFGWQVAPHHHLSLILDRSIKRPGSVQIYPYAIYMPDRSAFSVGNENLKSESLHTASLNYITDFRFADRHSLILNLSGEYINGRHLITSTTNHGFIGYANSGRADIVDFNVCAIYNYGVFSINAIANLFNNRTVKGSAADKYFYYNVSLTPMLQFNDGWGISAQFTYNSHIETLQSKLSDYLFSSVRFNKRWRNFTFFMELSDNFHEYAEDKVFGTSMFEGDITSYRYYNLHRPSLNLGVSIKF